MLFENWKEKLEPIIEKYKNKKHPLDYNNLYQLLIMVILSAQDSDANINKITFSFFEKYPTIKILSISPLKEIENYITKVTHFKNKAKWILQIAKTIEEDDKIPLSMPKLLALKGIGRKSANVILKETKHKAEGIIVDLHVIRVASRIGLTTKSENGNKIEKQLMDIIPYEIWEDIGMSLSFVGREICRPKNPKCEICLINSECKHHNTP